MDLGENIRRLRNEAGKSLRRVWIDSGGEGEGVDPSTQSAIETGGQPNPGIQTLKKIADAIGVTVTDLFTDETGCPVTIPEPRTAATGTDGRSN